VAVHFELLVAVGDFHIQGQFDGAQVFVGGATQMRQPGVVMRGEGVAKNQVDNLSKGTPMIGKLTGILSEKNPPQVLVDCNGVGYEVDVPMSTFYNLPANGEKVSLLTHFVVREDAQILFGFGTASERATFRLLIKISGVGPRMALGILSGLSADELARAVSDQDAGRLTKVPGIGKKTAERLLLELKGKLGADLGPHLFSTPDHQSDILQALLALGYNDKEAAAALKALPVDVGVSDGIKLALKSLAK
jgi:Holliday junction DNA helicase RuvA